MRQIVVGRVVLWGWISAVMAQSVLRILPPPGATFAPGQRFDIRIEADNLPRGKPGTFTFEINGKDQKKEVFGSEEFRIYPAPPQRGQTSNPINGGVIRREWNIEKHGKYELKATLTTADGKKITASSTIEVETIQPIANKAKNVILFVGDGMGPAIRTAARIVSKGLEGGRTRGLLEMDQMEANGLVMTSSLDALVTDSSPGAGAWATGNKSLNNWHGVFPDNNGPISPGLTSLDRNRNLAPPYLD